MITSNIDRDYLKQLTVLYVEDEAETAELFSQFLSRHVAQLVTAANGEEGLRAHAAHRPNIIITDIRMPVMDGITMIREIRASDQSVPIVVMTAFDQSEYLVSCINLGVDKYVVKPLIGPSSLQALTECAKRLRVEAQLAAALSETRDKEQRLKKKNEELELLIKGGQLGTWSWHIKTGRAECNAQSYSMVGYPPSELPDFEAWWELIHPDDRELVRTALDKHLAGRTDYYEIEHRLRHKSGHWIWIHIVGKVLQRDAAGTPLYAFGIQNDITNRKTSELQLARARSESDSIINQFLDSLIAVTPDLRIIRINQATCDLLGYAQEDLLGQPVSCLFHDPEPKVHETFFFYRTADREEIRNVELQYRTKDGRSLPMSFNLSLLRDKDDEKILGVVAGAKDVSDLRFALNKISRQNIYIETLLDNLPVGLVTLGATREILTSNRVFQRILNDWSIRLHMPQEEFARLLIDKALERVTANGKFLTVRFEEWKQVGFFSYYCSPIPSDTGQIMLLTFHDETQKKLVEEERKVLAQAIEQSRDAVVITDASHRIHYANPAALAASGYGAEEYIGKTPWVLHEEGVDSTAPLEEMRLSLDKGEAWSGTLEMRKKDGTILIEEISVSPVRNENGEPSHFVALKKDITEIRSLQQQLLLSQKLEAIGQLAAGIAHEINTPMQYIQNNLAFFNQAFADIKKLLVAIIKIEANSPSDTLAAPLQDANLDFLLTEIPECLEEVQAGIRRIVHIISALREFSHPGTNERVDIDINHALENAIIVCRSEWKYVAELDANLALELPLVSCYPDQLNQVFLNLLVNAAHAIGKAKETDPERHGRILVSTHHDSKWVEIRISDNGSGIPKNIRQRIFDPFFTTKEIGKGTGQGLAIAHNIVVKKHGGQINCTSATGEGTVFSVRLPISRRATAGAEDGKENLVRERATAGRIEPALPVGRYDSLLPVSNKHS
ncbi:MAG: PAS domain S-box protein [Desulfobulbus sp.]|nr:PAS domain S-box protein [Desulfobulbus sp.]